MRRRGLWAAIAAAIALGVLAPGASAADATKADVLFVFDTTGSMSNALAGAKAKIGTIENQVRSQVGDVQFAVAEMRDYPMGDYGEAGDEPWTLRQPVTADESAIQSAIDALAAGGGGDSPEAYGRALYESDMDPAIGWRPGARRLIVLIADDMPHDDDINDGIPFELQTTPSVGGGGPCCASRNRTAPSAAGDDDGGPIWDTNPDPGRDGVVGTPDDIDFQPLLDKLAHDGIPLMFVLWEGNDPTYLPYWKIWAGRTGGAAESSDEDNITDTVVGLVEQGAQGDLPPCPEDESRDEDGVCQPVEPVVPPAPPDPGPGPGPGPDPGPGPGPITGRPSASQLAWDFRPWLRFDSEEHWRPLEVNAFAQEPGMQVCQDRSFRGDPCEDVFGLGDILASQYSGSSGYIKIPEHDGDKQSPLSGCRAGVRLDCDSGPRSAFYYSATQKGSMLYLDYWWFLRQNQFPLDDHQGDWEGVTASVYRGTNVDVLYDVAFAAHNGPAWRYLALPLSQAAPGRVNVYLGQGTHAAYPRPCYGGCHQTNDGSGDNRSWLPEARFDGGASWGNNDDGACAASNCLQAIPRSSGLTDNPVGTGWATWPGRWGKGALIAVGGPPAAPGNQGRFKAPWNTRTTTRTGFISSAGAPVGRACDGSWFGPFVTAAVCDPAALSASFGNRTAGGKARFALHSSQKGATAGARPGIGQLLGDPLKSGQSVTLDGVLTNRASLLVKVRDHGKVAVARVGALGLGNGGKLSLRAAVKHGRPVVIVRGPGGKRTIVAKRPPVAAPLGVTATRRKGGRVRIAFVAPSGLRARVSLGSAHRTVRVRRGGSARRVHVDLRSRKRLARVQLIDGKRRGSAVAVRVRRGR